MFPFYTHRKNDIFGGPKKGRQEGNELIKIRIIRSIAYIMKHQHKFLDFLPNNGSESTVQKLP